jgi:hypothetical protein
MKTLFFIFGLVVLLQANVSVHKSATISKSLYPTSGIDELKELVLKKAKLEAAKEIFGEFLLSETVMRNGQIIDDIVRESHGGVIHIKGEPNFSETKNSIKVSIDAYATDADIKNVTPHKIILKNFVYSNPALALKDIKHSARDAFILEAISKKRPSVNSIQEARKLALEVDIIDESFDINTLDYTINGSVTYIPAFLRHKDSIKNTDSSSSIKYVKKEKKKDFYGKWSGFVMTKTGYSSSVEILINSFARASIFYRTLNCGGDLIVQEKTTRKLIFKEVLTFGEDRCKNHSEIILQKVTDKSLRFVQQNNSEKLFLGRVYLVE